MSKKLELLEPIVEDVLEKNPKTREDDYILQLKVLERFINTELPLNTIFMNHVELEIPALSSIVRCRRKIFERKPELKPVAISEIRTEEEKKYIEYSRN